MWRVVFRLLSLYTVLTLLFWSQGMYAAEPSAALAQLLVPDGTPVQLLLGRTISSAHAHAGDVLDFVVVRDVTVGDLTIISAGAIAHGTISKVRGRRILGIGGKLDFNLDSVQLVTGEEVQLRAHKEVKGASHYMRIAAEMAATALIYLPAAPVFLLSRGGDSTALKSTEITAHIVGNTFLAAANLPAARNETSELPEMLAFLPPRVLTAEGREGDMVNLIFVGQSDDLQAAFQRAGWIKTDKWKPIMAWHLLCERTHDAQLPMARFYLFGRVQDYSYALPDPDAIVSRRHHLRIWKTGYKVNGYPVWAGAATHDVAIEIAKRGRLINHTIDPQVDAERDFVGANLANASPFSRERYLQAADPVFSASTASGEAYYSDSRILLLDLHQATTAAADLPKPQAALTQALPKPGPVFSPPHSF